MQFFFLLPNRSLPYLKVAQGERNKKENAIFLFTAEPQPTLFKGVQGERNAKRKSENFRFA